MATLRVEVGERDFTVWVEGWGKEWGEAPDVSVVLSAPKLARGLSDIAMMLRATSGVLTGALREHLTGHFAAAASPQAKCQFCKLQGLVLAAEGRRRLSDREDRARAIPPTTRLPEGATRAAEIDGVKRAQLREAERLRRLPQLGRARSAEAWRKDEDLF